MAARSTAVTSGTVFFHTLGGVTATQDGEELALGGPKQRLVLALLLCSPGQHVATDRLVDSVWHEAPPSDPRGALQVYVSNLRRALEGVRLEHRGEGYVLHVDTEQVDAARFEELVDEGTGLVDTDPSRAATTLGEALALWGGRPFGELADEPALAVEAARLEELRLRALEARIEADLALGRHQDVVGELAELTTQHPLREHFWAQLMLARYRAGRQAEALSAYESARETLAERLGIDPSPFLQQLHTQVLRQDPAIETPSAPAPEPAGLAVRVGTVRGYELLDELGSGRLGVVLRGRQPSVEREVAIKVIRAELANDPDFVRCFEAEAQRVAQLEHPHIVPLYDYWREPDAAYLVMRWLRGGSLAHAVREGGWPWEAALGLLEQIAAALDHGHRHGVLHLGVKPTNVLLDLDGNGYVSDFGLARYADAPPPGTSPAYPAYLAPEHLTGQPLTAATDLFAFGLVAFELLTGRHPQPAEPDPHAADGDPPVLPDLQSHGAGLPDGVAEVLRQATAADPRQRFGSASEVVASLRGGTGAVAPPAPPTGAERNPYKGLQAFGEADTEDFFGREQLVAHLLERFDGTGQRARVVTVVGPSGSGKSSLVRAGLIPALRQGGARGSERWFVATMRPGPQPLAELERALTEVATCGRDEISDALVSGSDGLARAVDRALPEASSELLLVVDQFEELFSLAGGEQRRQFAAHLHHVATNADSRVRLVLTLRADFYDHPLLDPGLGEMVATSTMALPALSAEELERAVAEPAKAVGVRPHPELIAQITSDVAATPAALPLLQYALTELFERRSGDALTLEGYRAIGGVQGALAGRAEQLYASLDPAAQEACRQLCLRLVTVTEQRVDVRRRVRRDELTELTTDDTIEHVIETFGRHRLLTFDRDPVTREPTVEVAHEALLDAWDRLRGWIEQARTDLRMRQRLTIALEEWAASGYDGAYLLHGSRLDEFEQWSHTCQITLTPAEHQLLEASRAAETARQEREDARREHERRLERRAINRLRAVAVISVVAAVAAAGLSVFAFYQRDQADQQRRLASAGELATAASAALNDDPELSILLGMEAVRATREADGTVLADAETTLRRAIKESRVRQRLPAGSAVSVAPDGRIATLAAGGTLAIWGSDGEKIRELGDEFAPPVQGRGSSGSMHDLDVSPDGSRIVVADADRQGVILSTTGEEQTRLGLPGDGDAPDTLRDPRDPTRPRFSPDGQYVAAVLVNPNARASPRQWLGVWDARSGTLIDGVIAHQRNIRAHAFGPDGSRLVTAGADRIRLHRVDTGEQEGERVLDTEWERLLGEDMPSIESVAFHPDGDRLALGTDDGRVQLRRAANGNRIETFTGHTRPVRSVAFREPAGKRLVTGAGRQARVWEVDTGREVIALAGHKDAVTEAAFLGHGRVITTSTDNTTRVWDVSVPGGVEHGALPAAASRGAPSAVFSPEGSRLAASGPEGTVRIWDVETGKNEAVLEAPDQLDEPVRRITYSGDGETVAAVSSSSPERRVILVWDTDRGEVRIEGTSFAQVADLALSHDGSSLAIVERDGDVRVTDLGSDEEWSAELDAGTPSRVAYAPDDEQLLVGTSEAGVIVDAATGEEVARLQGVDGPIADVAVDGDRVVVAESDGAIGSFDPSTGDRIAHLASSRSVDDMDVWANVLAVARGDTIAVHHVDTRQKQFDFRYDHRVGSVHISPDGRYLATALSTPRIQLHVMGTDALLDLARQRVTRSLTERECRQYLGGGCPGQG